jgi:hypothetical protein
MDRAELEKKMKLQDSGFVTFDAEGNFIFADMDKNGVVNANDKVILLKHENNDLKETEFEKGIEIIKDYLLWNLRVEIIHPKRFHEIRFEDYKEIDRKLDVKSILNVSY